MDGSALWAAGLGVVAASIVYTVRAWTRPRPPAFLVGKWTTTQLLDALGPLDAKTVMDVFLSDMKRRGIDARDQLARLPSPEARHHLVSLAMCSQIGLALMYRWLARQFAPLGLIPCHDLYTHKMTISPEAVRHTLGYRLQRADGPSNAHENQAWQVDFMVRLCPHRQLPLHAMAIAAPRRPTGMA